MLLSHGWRASVVACGLVLTLAPGTALAWQTVKSGPGGTKVLATPTPDGTLSGQVDPGKPLTIGDKPTSGFYRCNAGKGLNGWCEETELDFGAKGAPRASNSTGQPGADAIRNSQWHKGSGALETNMYVGALLGLAFASGGTQFEFGVDGGYKLGPDWALGLYVTYSKTSSGSEVAGVSASGSSIIIAPEVNYWLPGELKGMHLGGKIGLSLASASTDSTGGVLPAGSNSTSSTNIVFGVAGGYDYPISTDITIGGEANFLIVSSSGSSSTTGSTTTTTSSGSASVFNLLVSLKYWL